MKGLSNSLWRNEYNDRLRCFTLVKKKHYKSSTVTLILNVTLLRFPWIPAVNEKMAAGTKKGSVWTQN